MGTPKFVIQHSNDQFHFRLTAANGEIILTSERYTTKASAENGVASVK
ncbi:MAG TPA: YegP family protein [Polyangiaceae bacterium]|nr:YegP family protein [Polyangiaceae bacterium]